MTQDDIEDMPLDTPSTGKIKGGPRKSKDIKPTAMKKIASPKSDKVGGGKSGFKAPKGSKISAPASKNFVKSSTGVKKAAASFKIPSPKMPQSKMAPMRKMRRG